MEMVGRLDGKVAWVSGGCSGMGLGAVEVMLDEGANVVVADIQPEKGAALESRYPGRLKFVQCDVTNEAQVAAAVQSTADAFGGLDILFNNAGAPIPHSPIEELDAEVWDKAYALLLRSTALACKYGVPLMKRRGGGAIINNSSGTALLTYGDALAYGTMKAGVLNFSRLLASELAPARIRVNVIVPGFVLTPILAKAIGASTDVADRMVPYLEERWRALQPIPDAGLPRDIGEAVSFLASDAARWITGVVLPVDGGLLVANQTPFDAADPRSIISALNWARDQVMAEGGVARS
jgi:NAD(P)-dependent dehydrogenase (short-subunit alcohol dehydrogenase family)